MERILFYVRLKKDQFINYILLFYIKSIKNNSFNLWPERFLTGIVKSTRSMTRTFRPKTRSKYRPRITVFPVCLLDHVLRCPISDCLITLQVNSRAKLAITQIRRTKYRLDEIYWKILYNDASSHYSMLPTGKHWK